jgi:hypothetical protein
VLAAIALPIVAVLAIFVSAALKNLWLIAPDSSAGTYFRVAAVELTLAAALIAMVVWRSERRPPAWQLVVVGCLLVACAVPWAGYTAGLSRINVVLAVALIVIGTLISVRSDRTTPAASPHEP